MPLKKTRIRKAIFAACFGAAASVFGANLISDFAPLQINNIWKYSAYSFIDEGSGESSSDSALRMITVKSKSQAGDTTVYHVSIRDSLFARTMIQKNGSNLDTTHPSNEILTDSGTVRETQNGSLSSSSQSLQIFFLRHSVPDTALYGKTTINGQSYWVYKSNGAATYVQSFGLLDWNILPQEHYLLISFNGASVGNYTVVGIFNPSSASHHFGSTTETQFRYGVLSGSNRNALGRISIPENIRP